MSEEQKMSPQEAAQTLSSLKNTFKALERLDEVLETALGLERAEQEAQSAIAEANAQREEIENDLAELRKKRQIAKDKTDKAIADWNRNAAEAKGAATDAIRKAKADQLEQIAAFETETAARKAGLEEQITTAKAELEALKKQIANAEKSREKLVKQLNG